MSQRELNLALGDTERTRVLAGDSGTQTFLRILFWVSFVVIAIAFVPMWLSCDRYEN